tara:strand:- start:459 stop:698 length:240 start_codon:yes stop_codon:yes gene_type:complete
MPTNKEVQLPPYSQRANVLRAIGSTWKTATESVGMEYRTLSKNARDRPNANDFLERQTQNEIDQILIHSKVIAAAPVAA